MIAVWSERFNQILTLKKQFMVFQSKCTKRKKKKKFYIYIIIYIQLYHPGQPVVVLGFSVIHDMIIIILLFMTAFHP